MKNSIPRFILLKKKMKKIKTFLYLSIIVKLENIKNKIKTILMK